MTSVASATEDPHDDDDLTRLIRKAAAGDQKAAQRLLELFGDTLRQIAHAHVRRRPPQATLRTTALVNEAYLKLFGPSGLQCNDRSHFLAIASKAMRDILVDYARHRNREKRRPPGQRLPIDDIVDAYERRSGSLPAVDAALLKLAKVDPRAAKALELRFFGGCTIEEIAKVMELSTRTVERLIAWAKAWLRREL